MDIEREIAGAATPTMAWLLRHLATVHEDGDDMKAARRGMIKVVEVERAIHGDRHWHVTDAQWDVRYSKPWKRSLPTSGRGSTCPPELEERLESQGFARLSCFTGGWWGTATRGSHGFSSTWRSP